MTRILIIKLGALGDVIMATSPVDRIVKHHVNDEVELLTVPAFASLFEGWAGLEIKALPRKGMRSFFNMLKWIRKQRFQRVYDLQSNDRSGLLCALSGIPERVGNHPCFPYTHHPPDPWRGQCHIYERSLQLLAAAGIEAEPGPPILPPATGTGDRVDAWLQQHGLKDGGFVIMHAGASRNHPEKRWPGFAMLAEKVAGAGMTVVWIGTEEDAALNRSLAEQHGMDATGEFSVLELAELGRHAAFAVTNDSGPMHILSASGIPVYGLFGPTNWRRNHAIGQKDNVIKAGSDRGFSPTAIDKLSIATVIERLKRDQRIS